MDHMSQLKQLFRGRLSQDFPSPQRDHQLILRIEQRDEAGVLEMLHQTNARRLINTANRFGQTTLGAAVVYLPDRMDIILNILDSGAKVNKRGARGETPLFKAVVKGRLDLVTLLLDRGANPNKPDTQYKFGPLSMAVRKGYTEIAHELLNHGASVHSGALLEAIEQNNHSIFERLLDAGASPLVRRGTMTPLHLAATIGSDYLIERLLTVPQLRALINDAQNNHLFQPHTALQMVRCKCWILELGDNGEASEDCCHTRVARYLMDAGADPNLVSGADKLSYSALGRACTEASLPMVKLLVERGAHLVAPSPYRHNVLECVKPSQEGDAVIRYFLRIVFAQESESVIVSCCRTAFHYAAGRELIDIINAIIQYKSDVNFWTTPYDGTMIRHQPLKLCVELSNFGLLLHLLQLGANPNAGLIPSYQQFQKLSLESQLKHHFRYRFASSPLNLAIGVHDFTVRAQRLRTINCLLYYGANPNIPGLYYTPLHGFLENFGTINADVIPTVKLMVLSRLDMRAEQWLVERLQPGVPLGSPPLRQWLIENVKQPMPLFHRCIAVLRSYLAPEIYSKAPQLPLPKPLIHYVMLRHIFTLPRVDSKCRVIEE